MTPHLTTDKPGRIHEFSHHDGALEAVLLEDSGRIATLIVRSSNSVVQQLILREVVGLHVTDLRQGNIIHSIQIWTAATAHEASFDVGAALSERLFLDIHALTPTTVILHLTPSYGADVLAVCGEVQIENVGQ